MREHRRANKVIIAAKPSFLLLALTFLLLGASALFLVRQPGCLPRPSNGDRDSFSIAESSLLRPGDLILRRGSSIASDLIVTVLQDGSGLSHCALVMANNGKEISLLHSVNASFGGADGVQVTQLAAFNRNSLPHSLVVLRPLATAAELHAIETMAENFRDHPAAFDNDFDLSDRRSLYCSELMVSIFEAAGWWPPTRNGLSPLYRMTGKMLNFQTFLTSGRFRVIISHNPAWSPVAGPLSAFIH